MLAGCATAPPERSVRDFTDLYTAAQAACYALELADDVTQELRDECTRAKYFVCRKAFSMQRIIWVSSGWGFRRGRDGVPYTAHEMRYEMSFNRCHMDF